MSELGKQALWISGLAELREHEQAHLRSRLDHTPMDVTEGVNSLADEVWGPHTFSDKMRLVVKPASQVARASNPHVYAVDETLDVEHIPIQAGYVDTNTGVVIATYPVLVYEWLEGHELPVGSPFANIRKEMIERLSMNSLAKAARKIRTDREAIELSRPNEES